MSSEKMTHLFFVRHGQSIHNRDSIIGGREESPLSDLGIEQAESLALMAKDLEIDAAYTSTLSRAYDTCDIILKKRKLEAERLDELCEQDYGDWEGKDYRELIKLHPEMFQEFREDPLNARPGNGENLAEMSGRVRKVIDRIAAKHEGEHVLIVCHGGVIRTAICLLLDVDLTKHFFRFEVANASLNVVRISAFGGQLVGLGMREANFWNFHSRLID